MTRNYSIDLVRFICMLMVVTGHYFLYGGLRTAESTSQLNMMSANILSSLSRVAVNTFFLITGYFAFKNQGNIRHGVRNSICKTITLDIKMIVYGLILYSFFLISGHINFDLLKFTTNFFPLLTNRYWFITTYICLILLLPFISNIKQYDDKTFLILISFFVFIDGILPLFGFSSTKGIEYCTFHAITMAVLGIGISKFEQILIKVPVAIWLVLYLLTIFVAVGLNVMHLFDSVSFSEYNSIFVIISSVSFFIFMIFFCERKISTQFFSKISPYVLGIYLVNDNEYVRKVFYFDILHCDAFYASNYMLIHFIFSLSFFVILGLACDYIIHITFLNRIILAIRGSKSLTKIFDL